MKILVIHGPNLNLLGTREKNIYGKDDLNAINERITEYAKTLNVDLETYQSNHEGDIVDKIQQSMNKIDGIIINPAAYTHTSVAIRDAISGTSIPAVEVHLSNIHSREEFRHKSYTAGVCIGQICGFGANSYNIGLKALVEHLESKKQ
ncbi:MAG: type II 3-dehydroquinate dehydratase [Vampirovibrionia bacterium]